MDEEVKLLNEKKKFIHNKLKEQIQEMSMEYDSRRPQKKLK
jgi:hypothetical protein